MKKMNRKGFTLIELLAVIVVLAIILVITVPSILNTLGGTRQDAFDASANSVADWFEKNYSLAQFDSSKANSDYNSWATGKTLSNANSMSADVLAAAGLNSTDYSVDSKVIIKANGRACVKLVVPSTTSGGTTTYSGKFSSLTNKFTYSSACTDTDKSAF